MRSIYTTVFITLIMVCIDLASSGALAAGSTDLTEFKNISDAKAFGWKPADKTKFTITQESKVGRSALRIQPEPNSPEKTTNQSLHPNKEFRTQTCSWR